MEKTTKKENEADLQEAICTAIEDVKRKLEKDNDPNVVKEPSAKGRMLWGSLKRKLLNKPSVNETQEVNCRNDLEELNDMTTMLSVQRERNTNRRAGISERNQTERLVVQKTLENLVINKNITDMGQ